MLPQAPTSGAPSCVAQTGPRKPTARGLLPLKGTSAPTPTPTHPQVYEAAEAACIHETIMSRFPQQYDTVVGERGLRLRWVGSWVVVVVVGGGAALLPPCCLARFQQHRQGGTPPVPLGYRL